MKCIVAGDREPIAARIRETLASDGHHASEVWLTTADKAVFRAAQLRPHVVIVIVPESDDRNDSLLQEIKEACPASIVVVGPSNDPKRILRVLHGGADTFIDEQNLEKELPAALRRLRTDVLVDVEQGRLITVLGATGGCGASTIATNVAAVMCGTYGSCGLIDMRLEAGDLGAMLNLEPVNSLASFCNSLDRIDDELFERCLTKHQSGISLLAAPVSYRDANKVSVRGIRKALHMMRSRYPIVVVDLDPSYQDRQAQVLIQSDLILLILRLDFTSLRRVRRMLDYIEELKIDAKRIRLMVNRHRRSSEMNIADVKKALGIEVLGVVPDDVGRVAHANNLGVPVVIQKPRAPVSRALANIAVSLNGKHEAKRQRG